MSNAKRVVLITGASSGIGLAAAEAFLENGDTVYCLSRSKPENTRIGFVSADVTDESAVTRAVSSVLEKEKRIDIVVCNAGMGVSGAVEFEDISDAQRQFDVCFFGAARTAKAALSALRASKGMLLFTSSVAGSIAIPFQAYYSAAKAAINALVFALRNEVKHTGVRVAAVLPGDIKTGFTGARNKCMAGLDVYPAMGKSVATMEHDEKNGMPPSVIGKKLVSLSKQTNPKPFSTAGLQYKLFLFIAKVLPARFVCFLVGLLYAK